MANGEDAMIINGPSSWSGYEGAGVNIGIAPLPPVGGNAAPPFLGVQALAINAATSNTDLAVEFIENYLATDEGLAVWNANDALGALADISAAEAQTDEKVSAMRGVAAIGVPMPSNPELGAFWSAMAPALTNITSQAQEAEAAPNDAVAPETLLEARDAIALRSDLQALTLTTPKGVELRNSGLRTFASVTPAYVPEGGGRLIRTTDGAVLTTDHGRGFCVTVTGETVPPGWRVSVGLQNFERVFRSEGIRAPVLAILVWTMVFAVASVVLTFALGLTLAVILQWEHLRFKAA